MCLCSAMLGCLLLWFAPSVYGRGFLETENNGEMAVPDMIALLLSEANPKHVRPIGRGLDFPGLQSMFQSLPKNLHGKLDLSVARYALHRHFDHRHRWFVHGLHPNSNVSDETETVANALHTAGKFDKKGLSLPALTSLASTFDDLIRGEVAMHVENAYQHILGQTVESAVSGKVLKTIVHDYMTIYISGASWKGASKKDVEEDEQFLEKYTKGWTENLAWIQQTTIDKAKKESNCKHDDVDACNFDYNTTIQIVKHVVEKYGHYNDHECHKIKTGLLEMEEPRTGRVHLSDFYKAGLSGAWEFNEKIDYLRSLGALDESKPTQPRVIVTNYLSSWVNCLTPSRFYSVCCPNECEDFLRIIEKHVAGPAAGVDQIMSLIETQSTLKEDASTHLAYFRYRLVDISRKHRGKIPLHGRLFAQWMHHVFPHTCPYPHETDKMNPMTPDQWLEQTGQDNIKASEEEIRHTMQSLSVDATGVPEPRANNIPWSDVEDSLVIIRPTPAPQMRNNYNGIAVGELLGVLVVLVLVMWVASYLQEQRKLPKTKFCD